MLTQCDSVVFRRVLPGRYRRQAAGYGTRLYRVNVLPCPALVSTSRAKSRGDIGRRYRECTTSFVMSLPVLGRSGGIGLWIGRFRSPQVADQETQERWCATLNCQICANLSSTPLKRLYKQVAMDSLSLFARREMEWRIVFVEVGEHIRITPELKKRVGWHLVFETLHHSPVGSLFRRQAQDPRPLGDVVGGLNTGASSGEDTT